MDNSILIVDDVQMFIEIQKEFLQETRVSILTARNGLEALEVMGKTPPNLVIMDLQMPIMDGATCCKTIKSDPELTGIPVILITSSWKAEDYQICISAGCDYFMTKTFDRNMYLEVARKYMPGINRRDRRVPFNTELLIHANHKTSVCKFYDLSTGGAFVVSDYQAVPREVIRVSFPLPGGTKIDCPARIIWVNDENSKRPRGFGLQFALLSVQVKEELRAIVNGAGY